ncbi:MAG: hypothetical protein K2N38_13820 [Oscillospiraceae bacterium]|nr:hypothetical protein [Oscillospiraceae bacterium]
MTRDNIEAQCRKISANYSSSGVCRFVRGGGVLCFIDTSQPQNGTRGIAFMREKMTVCLDGEEPVEVFFSDIREIRIISSFEDFFADELSLSCEDGEVRISDYSLDKSELKRFIEELIVESEKAREHRAQAEEYAKIIAERLAQSTLREERAPVSETFALPAEKAENVDSTDNAKAADEAPKETPAFVNDFIPEEGVPVIHEMVMEIPIEKTVTVPEDYKPAPIPEEKINWISGSFYTKKHVVPEETPVIAVAEEPPAEETAETVKETAEIAAAEEAEAVIESADKQADEPDLVVLYSRGEGDNNPPSGAILFETATETKDTHSDELGGEVLAQIENMSREETLSFLADSLNEINGTAESIGDERQEEPKEPPKTDGDPLDIGIDLKTISEISAPPEEEADDGKLSIEPIWGDIYIKASRNLRELIEDGKLSMDQIKTELREKLLSSAKAFAEITSDTAKVPKVLMPKITELRSAAGDFDEYFKSGEDIGVRAMFFMMYQMLSYADRIAETPETKERLNDFFRRFGSAGITLSMLDMRV